MKSNFVQSSTKHQPIGTYLRYVCSRLGSLVCQELYSTATKAFLSVFFLGLTKRVSCQKIKRNRTEQNIDGPKRPIIYLEGLLFERVHPDFHGHFTLWTIFWDQV